MFSFLDLTVSTCFKHLDDQHIYLKCSAISLNNRWLHGSTHIYVLTYIYMYVYIFQRLRLTGSHPFQEPSDSCCVYNFCHAHTGDVLEQCFQHCFTSMPSRHVEGKHCTVNRAPLFKCCTSHSSTHSAEFSPKTVKTKSSSFRNDASVTL